MNILGVFTVPDWLLLLVSALGLLYMYLTRNHGYWKKQGVPYLKAPFIIDPLIEFLNKPFHLLELERFRKYGRIYGFFEGSKPALTVADPELVKNILVKDFPIFANRRVFTLGDEMLDKMMSILPAEEWRRVRPAVSPAFTSGKLRKMNPLVLDCTNALTDNFLTAAEKKENVDLKQYFSNFTMDVIARTAFGTKLNTQADPYNPFVTMGRKIFGRDFSFMLIIFFVFPKIAKLFGRTALGGGKEFDFFKQLSLKIMNEREETKTRKEDFLQLMMDAQKGSLNVEESSEKISSLFTLGEESDSTAPNLKQKELTLTEVLAQCVLFFIAGFDTTASVLSFTGYLLALNPEVQKKLQKEIDEFFEENGNEIHLDKINHLKYLDMVLSESLRVFPPALRLERTAMEDYVLGDTGITVPKGSVVGIPAYAMHHDPEFFPDPNKFDPERFSEENVSSIKPYTYLPFGAGPRNCVGMRFALMAVKSCLVNTLRSVEFSRCPETKVPLDFYRGGGLFQPKEVTVAVNKRS